MIKLKINNRFVEVAEGISVLKVAESLGIEIPTMCFKDGFGNHPSCMLCLVKDAKNGQLHPSCALPAEEGMEIITDDEEIYKARKESLELLLSDHVGDCEAPCRTACPAYMDIPKMNRLIAERKFDEALRLVKEEIALPLILGYICPAPCEGACRRSQAEAPVSICELKKMVADEDLKSDDYYLPEKLASSEKNVAVIGSGPAGLSAAFHLLKLGHSVVIFDQNEEAGGSLRYDIPEEKLPNSAVGAEVKMVENYGAEFRLNTTIDKTIFEDELKKDFDAVVFALGNFEDGIMKDFGFENNKFGLLADKATLQVNGEGIFACGNVIRSRKMAVTSVAQGKQVAHSIHDYLAKKTPEKIYRMFNSRFGKLKPEEVGEYLKESPEAERLELNKESRVFTMDQAVEEAGRCMHCECRKPHTCKLRIFSDEYQADRRRFMFGERKTLKKHMQHELIVYEPEKCIRCNLCVDISALQKDSLGFTSIGRGYTVEINIPFNKNMKDIFDKTALECAEACPTGAISLK
ncbi:FAD-dependent oxidoreductase [Lentimicrobium sp. S6]|uniref:FAD-dependent oxidoreductase n=1 Tax=Lentimicrobium sp. S6 TaxID=2735872 RepID=UPI0015539625|nr:FAD-dependent oxidoreductase [Lentimicrobium sp. S6]NPD45361.1 FAD-dependent oxidoreductase [Lentimicrobium sp. S6]